MNANQIADEMGMATSKAYWHCKQFERRLKGVELW